MLEVKTVFYQNVAKFHPQYRTFSVRKLILGYNRYLYSLYVSEVQTSRIHRFKFCILSPSNSNQYFYTNGKYFYRNDPLTQKKTV